MIDLVLILSLVAICFFSGWWCRRSVLGGLATAAIGPVLILTFWFILKVIIVGTAAIIGRMLGFELGWVESLPMVVRICFDPSTVITVIGFILFCRFERINHAPPPEGFSDEPGKGFIGYRTRPHHIKNLPTIRKFRY